MKKIIAYSTALALAASVNLAMPTAAMAQNQYPEACRTSVSNGFLSSVGECMSAIPEACQLIDSWGLLQVFGYRNRGDCVSSIRAFVR